MSNDFEESGPSQMRERGNTPAMMDTIYRLERKVDRLSEAVSELIRFEERQSVHSAKLAEHDKRLDVGLTRLEVLEKKVDQWINRGIGIWAVAMIAFSVYQVIHK